MDEIENLANFMAEIDLNFEWPEGEFFYQALTNSNLGMESPPKFTSIKPGSRRKTKTKGKKQLVVSA